MDWDWTLFGIAISSLFIGWYMGTLQIKRQLKQRGKQDFSSNYFEGINYLLAEKPDHAVDLFIKNLEVNLDTIETHLNLGTIFRKRGESDRAIKIHQNLLAQTGLNRVQQENVQLELANDYLAAGLLDRAERILLELVDLGGRNRKKALEKLVFIYEQMKDWNLALRYGQMLLKADGQTILTPLGHYSCECAEQCMKTGNFSEALVKAKEALQYDQQCVRASILQAKIEAKTGNYKSAIKSINRINQQDEIWLGEIVDFISDIYEKNQLSESIIPYLSESIKNKPQIKLAIKIAESMELKNDSSATQFLIDYIKTNPSWIGLATLIEYSNEESENKPLIEATTINTLKHLMTEWLSFRVNYYCTNCGFKAHSNHWQCPSCKKWSTVRPAEDNMDTTQI